VEKWWNIQKRWIIAIYTCPKHNEWYLNGEGLFALSEIVPGREADTHQRGCNVLATDSTTAYIYAAPCVKCYMLLSAQFLAVVFSALVSAVFGVESGSRILIIQFHPISVRW
jgi:hypothetical protein